MNAEEQRDLNGFLAGMYEHIRQHEQALNTLQITAGALVQALGQTEPRFRPAYTEAFEALKAGPLGQSLAVQLGLIDAVIQGLRRSG